MNKAKFLFHKTGISGDPVDFLKKFNPSTALPLKDWFWKDGYATYDELDAKKYMPQYILNPATLIELRLKVIELSIPKWLEVERGKLVGKLQSAGSCILKGKYEPAAEKLAEDFAYLIFHNNFKKNVY